MSRKRYFLYGLGAAGGLLAAIFSSLLFFQGLKTGVVANFPTPDCDVLLSPCTSALPSGERVTLSLSSTFLPTMIPITIEVSLENFQPLGISVNFVGIDMFMGDNQPQLVRREDGVFIGKTVLPICAKNCMPWEARVYIETERGRIAAPFRFLVQKPANALSSTY